MPSTQSLDKLQSIYVAFYGRPADPAGQRYWAEELDASGGALGSIINSFAASAEYDQNYGHLTAAEQVNALYQQSFGRDAESGGLDYWSGRLQDGSVAPGEVALAILEGAQGGDLATVNNRLDVAHAFTAQLSEHNVAYTGRAINAARDFLADITATDTSRQDAMQGLAAMIEQVGSLSEPATGVTLISSVQGAGAESAMTGSSVTVEAVVTAVMPGLKGLFLQEETYDSDGNPHTSEGIFVYMGNLSTADFQVGDVLRVQGAVSEYQGKTQLTVQSLDTVSKVGQTSLPTITPISLPQQGQSSLEAYEGMRVVLEAESGDLMLTDHSLLGRYGQVTVTSGGRLEQYTESNLPSVSGYEQWLTDAKARSMILDDGNTAQNPDPILFGRNDERLSAENTLRGGDRVADVEGVLDFAFGDWRMQLTEGVNFAGAERPQVPDLAGSRLEVGVLNLQNYFNTLDQTGAKTVTLDGQEHDPRGADNAAEFLRQQDKLVAAINESGAEVMGLLELENNGYGADSAIQSLVNALNADNAARGVQSVRWAFSVPHDEAGNITSAGNDAISTGIIYNSLAVTPAGEAKTHTQGAFAAHNRAPVLQAFEERATGEVFTVVVNHFKSKGSVVNGEYASGDGQGNNSPTRVVAAEELLQWLASDPSGTGDEDVLILGDLNAYTREDPVQALVAGGYHSLVSDHTYAYNGFWGALDHALASSTLADQVTQAAVWHINADEPSALDYNTDYVSPVQAENLYANDPYRSSDHDMILVGLELF